MTTIGRLKNSIVQSVFSSEPRRRNDLLLFPLAVASYFYGQAISLRSYSFYRGIVPARKLSVPVISVGNITVGGTGKTPTTLFVARALQNGGMHPAILSRGYKGKAKGAIHVVSDGETILLSAEEAGDEPCLLAEHLPGIPVLTGKDRGMLGEYAIKNFAVDVVILDDGFQHLKLRRDVDIVCLDGKKPFGNGWMLPRGPLREQPHALSRAQLALITESDHQGSEQRQDLESRIHTYHASLPLFYARYAPTRIRALRAGTEHSPDYLLGRQVIALAGVARPQSFVRLLTSLGATVVKTLFYSDHHHYRMDDLSGLAPDIMVVTTEKDAVKLRVMDLHDQDLWVLSIALQVERESRFLDQLKKYLPSSGVMV